MMMKICKAKISNFVPEEIIVDEILMRLPIKFVFRFNCVSKRYNFIIASPKFGQIYQQRALKLRFSSGLMSALLYPFTNISPDQNMTFTFTPGEVMSVTAAAGTEYGGSSINIFFVSLPNDKTHKIVGSSSGLILSLFHPDNNNERFSLCVSSPLTKQSVQLPEPPSTPLTDNKRWVFGIAARPLSAYKVVLIERFPTVMIFSSDTGSWLTWEASPCSINVFDCVKLSFSYKGILHWVRGKGCGDVVTYAPFCSPNRFDILPLPEGRSRKSRCKRLADGGCRYKGFKCVIYSGENEMLRYCDMSWITESSEVMMMWRLVEYDKGEWCFEKKILLSPSPCCCAGVMVAPNPLNPRVICHPIVRHNNLVFFHDQSTCKTLCFLQYCRPPVATSSEVRSQIFWALINLGIVGKMHINTYEIVCSDGGEAEVPTG